MGKKLQEQLAKIQDDVFSYFNMVNPHPEIGAMVLNYDISLVEFIDPTFILNHSKASEILLKNDYNERWFKIFDKAQYIDETIFLNIISQASHISVPYYDEEEKRKISHTAFYNNCFHSNFLSHICQNEKINHYFESIRYDEAKLIELCSQNFYFFLLTRDNQLLPKEKLKPIFMDYFHGINTLKDDYGYSRNAQLAKLSIYFFEQFTSEEFKLVSQTFFSHYITGYHLKSNIQYFKSDDILEHFIQYSKKSLHDKMHYSHDYGRNLFHFFHSINEKGDNAETYLKKLFKELTKDHGVALTYILLDAFKDKGNEIGRDALCQYLKPIDFVIYLEQGKFYSSHLELFKLLPSSFWQKMQGDDEAYTKLKNVFAQMDSNFVKEACAVLPFIFKKEETLYLINHYLTHHPKEMMYIYQTLLEPNALNEKLYEYLNFDLDSNYNIQESAIKTVTTNYKKDPHYIEQYKDSIEFIFNKIFAEKNLRMAFADLGNYNFKADFCNLLIDHFPQVIMNHLSPNNDQIFLSIQQKPTFLDTDQIHDFDITKQRLQQFFWDRRTKEFSAPCAHILKKQWDEALKKKDNKHLYDKFYFEHAVIREPVKSAKRLKI